MGFVGNADVFDGVLYRLAFGEFCADSVNQAVQIKALWTQGSSEISRRGAVTRHGKLDLHARKLVDCREPAPDAAVQGGQPAAK